MVFSTGYQANLAMIAGLAGPRDVVLIDADSHASIYDACKLSGATIVRFRHNDAADLDRRLEPSRQRRRLPAGDRRGHVQHARATPRRCPSSSRSRSGTALGCWSTRPIRSAASARTAAGWPRSRASRPDVDFVVGTFSKSLGAIGGFGASNHPQFDLLRLCARPYMFTASPSPASIASVHAALRRIEADPGLRDAALGQCAAASMPA